MIPHLSRAGLLTPALLAALFACGSTSPSVLPPDEDLSILFIGNSLTYVNDLPGMVQRLAAAASGVTPTVESVAFGDYSLEDHWNQGDALKAIAARKWDLVVLQQGPSALPESRVLLVEYVKKFAAEIRRGGGRPAIYMVWPESSRAQVWDDVTASYAAAAQAVDGLLLPAGEAFRSAARIDPALELFSGDGFHPTSTGTYLAALVIYARATGRSPVGISTIARLVGLSPGEIEALEAGAADAIQHFGTP
jgi:hypothetical protein